MKRTPLFVNATSHPIIGTPGESVKWARFTKSRAASNSGIWYLKWVWTSSAHATVATVMSYDVVDAGSQVSDVRSQRKVEAFHFSLHVSRATR